MSGLYSGIFAMYLQCHGSNKGTGVKTKNILFYALCFLYVLYLVAISLDIARVVLHAASEVGNNILPIIVLIFSFFTFALTDCAVIQN